MAILTVKVIKAHDGIQQGEVIRFADCAVIRYMIDNGYDKLVKTEDDATDQQKKSDAVNDKSAASTSAVDKVKNMFKRKKK